MAFHVPYSQRHRPGPIYIGFDEPPRFQRRQTNWWGFNGLLLAIASLFTCGLLAPISLLVSLIGLRRRPRKAAIAGTMISLVSLGMIMSMVFVAATEESRHQARVERVRHSRQVAKQVDECRDLLQAATVELGNYRDEHDGVLPDAIDGNVLVIKFVDPWGQELRYEESVDGALVRSAGPDKKFDTTDDVTMPVEGKIDNQPLLPLDID